MNNQQIASQIAKAACHYDVFDFVRGQTDCREGVPHKDGNGESYDAGYAAQYGLEQIQSNGAR